MAKKLGWKGDPHSINVALSVNDTITRPIALSESQAWEFLGKMEVCQTWEVKRRRRGTLATDNNPTTKMGQLKIKRGCFVHVYLYIELEIDFDQEMGS